MHGIWIYIFLLLRNLFRSSPSRNAAVGLHQCFDGDVEVPILRKEESRNQGKLSPCSSRTKNNPKAQSLHAPPLVPNKLSKTPSKGITTCCSVWLFSLASSCSRRSCGRISAKALQRAAARPGWPFWYTAVNSQFEGMHVNSRHQNSPVITTKTCNWGNIRKCRPKSLIMELVERSVPCDAAAVDVPAPYGWERSRPNDLTYSSSFHRNLHTVTLVQFVLDWLELKTLQFVNKTHWLNELDGQNDDEHDMPHSRSWVNGRKPPIKKYNEWCPKFKRVCSSKKDCWCYSSGTIWSPFRLPLLQSATIWVTWKDEWVLEPSSWLTGGYMAMRWTAFNSKAPIPSLTHNKNNWLQLHELKFPWDLLRVTIKLNHWKLLYAPAHHITLFVLTFIDLSVWMNLSIAVWIYCSYVYPCMPPPWWTLHSDCMATSPLRDSLSENATNGRLLYLYNI